VAVLAAANRDPAQFPNPDRFDIGRSQNRHVAFGHSIHMCLGAALARVEGQIAIGAVVRRFPNLRLLDEGPAWVPSLNFRALGSLPVMF
jgi:cytochrome P450